jgi:hypothetical protein
MSAPVASLKPGFDPSEHLTQVGGTDYLPVKWRLAWLRTLHPDATIETELFDHVDNVAIFRAEVRIPAGGVATGWGSQSAGDFRDYLEKAETKAIGRALAALGFGTQFCADHEVGAESGAVITDLETRRSEVGGDDPAPKGQLHYLRALAGKLGIDEAALEERAMDAFGLPVESLSRSQATRLQQIIRKVPKPPPASSQRPEGARPTALPGVTAVIGSAGNDQHSR